MQWGYLLPRTTRGGGGGPGEGSHNNIIHAIYLIYEPACFRPPRPLAVEIFGTDTWYTDIIIECPYRRISLVRCYLCLPHPTPRLYLVSPIVCPEKECHTRMFPCPVAYKARYYIKCCPGQCACPSLSASVCICSFCPSFHVLILAATMSLS